MTAMRTAPRRSRVRPPIRAAATSLVLATTLVALACGPAADTDATATAGAADSAATGAGRPVTLMPADVADARREALAASVAMSGVLEPARRAELKAQLDGLVATRSVDRGSAVRRGDVLLTLSADGVQQAAVSADAGITAARAQLAVATQQRDAARTLFAKGAISQVDLRTAEARHEAAAAEVEAAVARAAGARESAGQTRIVAPMDGAVSARHVDVGEPVSKGNPLLTVVDASTLELAAFVGVDEASRLRIGQAVEFTVAARPGETFAGRIARIDPQADPATRQVGVYAELPNRVHKLIAGQYATGRIVLDEAATLVVVPTAAMRTRGDTTYVAVIESGRVAERRVRVAARDDRRGLVGLADGLAEGARVLVMPGTPLADGTPVRVLTTVTPDDSVRRSGGTPEAR